MTLKKQSPTAFCNYAKKGSLHRIHLPCCAVLIKQLFTVLLEIRAGVLKLHPSRKYAMGWELRWVSFSARLSSIIWNRKFNKESGDQYEKPHRESPLWGYSILRLYPTSRTQRKQIAASSFNFNLRRIACT